MAKVEASVVINRPIDEVFTFATTPHNAPQWQSGVLEATQTSPGPVGVGTTLHYVMKFLGRRLDIQSVITVYTPHRQAAFEQTSGPFPSFVATLLCEPADGGTRVTGITEVESGGFFKLGEPILMRMVQRQSQGDFETLKDLLEAQPSA